MKIQDLYKLKIRKKLAHYNLSDEQIYFLLTIVVGVLSGITAVFINKAVHFLSHLMGTNNSFNLIAWISGAVAIFLSGYLTTRFFPETSGSGIPAVKVLLVAKNGIFNSRFWPAKLITTILTLISGLRLGREGPTVAVSAGLGSTLAQTFSLSKKRTKSLVAQASAGAIAAAFNTPIAAIFFTLEEVVGDLNAKSIGPIVISALLASYTSYLFLGNYHLFPEFEYSLTETSQLIIYLAIGIVSAFLGPAWVRFVLFLRKQNMKLFKGHRLSIIMTSFVLVALAGMIAPLILGGGHIGIREALLGNIEGIHIIALLFVLKFLATGISYACGASGGLFMPTLFIGAMVGALVASVFQLISPEWVGEIGPYALVGMGAYFVSVIRAPFTSILIIFELTHDYNIILPLMLANISSYLISSQLKFNKGGIYEALSEQDGLHLPSREDDELLDQLHVEDAMKKDVASLSEKMPLAEALVEAGKFGFSGYPVMRGDRIFGVTTVNEIRIAIAKDEKKIHLKDICQKDLITVFPDQSLLVAFHKLKKHNVGRIFVVSRINHNFLLGIITAEDIVSQFGFHIQEDSS